LHAIADYLAAFGATVRANIDSSGAAGDQGTADHFTEVSRATDKQLWMVEAHLLQDGA
jgi:starvation-inducible DNA-binding protein